MCVYEELPSKLDGIIQPDTVEIVKNLWQHFDEVYSIVTCKNPSEERIINYFKKVKGWVNLFVSLRDMRVGYKSQCHPI